VIALAGMVIAAVVCPVLWFGLGRPTDPTACWFTALAAVIGGFAVADVEGWITDPGAALSRHLALLIAGAFVGVALLAPGLTAARRPLGAIVVGVAACAVALTAAAPVTDGSFGDLAAGALLITGSADAAVLLQRQWDRGIEVAGAALVALAVVTTKGADLAGPAVALGAAGGLAFPSWQGNLVFPDAIAGAAGATVGLGAVISLSSSAVVAVLIVVAAALAVLHALRVRPPRAARW
jgi:hypothetical protein